MLNLLAVLMLGTNAITGISREQWLELTTSDIPPAVLCLTDAFPAEFPAYSLTIPANAMTVETNTVTVTTDNRSCSECARTCGDSLVWDGHKLRLHLGECDRNVPPTERYETTTITEVNRLAVTWLGERRELVKETVLSNVTVKYVLKPPEWEKVRTDIGSPVPPSGVIYIPITNICYTNMLIAPTQIIDLNEVKP